MDAQTRVADTAALAALVQCLVRLEALEGSRQPPHARRRARRCSRRTASSPRATAWRRASSTRRARSRRPAREWLEELLDGVRAARRRARLHRASSTRCATLAATPPARCASARARAAARRRSSGALMRALHADFTTARAKPAVLTRLMCGIAGELRRDAPPDREALARMSEVLAPRGPDGHGHVARRRRRARPPAALDHRPVRARRAADGRRRARADDRLQRDHLQPPRAARGARAARATRSSRTPTPRCC